MVPTERLTYPAIRPLTNLLGLKLDGVEIDSDGMLPAALEDCCRRLAPTLLFTSPTVQNPTTSIMPAARRAEIAAIARKYNVLIVEDDVQALLVDDPPPPISTYAPEISWYVMSLAKSISIGLRVAYPVGPDADSVSSLRTNLRSVSSWFVSPLSAALVQTWMQDGSAAKILTEVKNESRARQRLASEILHDFEFETKPCALHLWMPLPAG
ncbi:aminotransferase class I/II-fold pyridoxal phosphate-dependent enzyme [Sinorhizobium medicae]|uniref:aminotransferase class I/II-fold pyridoxal phosphate-dependent enzyme n=1 Tax=Sinorhizobium medicae TaxID=110321 RepID=UPI001295DD96|nr:aminotransferase class I/II-fold pyridoxal phosphate-dependent enzyme [Sinorhizobium medicae]MDX0967282.1 aminotransferase class I/II-fold pyridoxal phosphate-dependent enzyme [Sinorhizobium medicae]MQV47026.1 aminotransferase class I/II-fold pyridoxal phosphate-dependent enzyme [Sinorhizobium medicae]MQV53078.1 aminotransferase class I/II-fold pyridoxal phosphate-dependent enzyme [Sinorhizobium medicae]MQV75132.1 aminotransferase class I/II-fold pyridoxal phosphate-dependent enzyme [Sinorhi